MIFPISSEEKLKYINHLITLKLDIFDFVLACEAANIKVIYPSDKKIPKIDSSEVMVTINNIGIVLNAILI